MEVTLDAVTRSGFGKNESRRLRRDGRIPAVVYGGAVKGGAPQGVPITVDPKPLLAIMRSESGMNTLIQLSVDGANKTRVLLKDYQVDPIKSHLLHVDFYRVAMDRTITVSVPVILKGEAKGVKQQSGLLDFVYREIEVECLPGQIPEHLEIDVSELLIGQSVRMRDIVQDGSWKPVSPPETLLVHVIAPKAEVVEEPEAAEEVAPTEQPAEPEVIKKGKTEQEEPGG